MATSSEIDAATQALIAQLLAEDLGTSFEHSSRPVGSSWHDYEEPLSSYERSMVESYSEFGDENLDAPATPALAPLDSDSSPHPQDSPVNSEGWDSGTHIEEARSTASTSTAGIDNTNDGPYSERRSLSLNAYRLVQPVTDPRRTFSAPPVVSEMESDFCSNPQDQSPEQLAPLPILPEPGGVKVSSSASMDDLISKPLRKICENSNSNASRSPSSDKIRQSPNQGTQFADERDEPSAPESAPPVALLNPWPSLSWEPYNSFETQNSLIREQYSSAVFRQPFASRYRPLNAWRDDHVDYSASKGKGKALELKQRDEIKSYGHDDGYYDSDDEPDESCERRISIPWYYSKRDAQRERENSEVVEIFVGEDETLESILRDISARDEQRARIKMVAA